MSTLQGPVVCPSVRRKQGGVNAVPAIDGPLMKAKIQRSGIWRFKGINSHRVRVRNQPGSKTVTCSFSSSSNGNGSMAESFNENDSDYVNSSVVEAVEVKSGPDGFIIKMRDGKHLRCAHNNPQGGHLPDYAPHPAIVLKMEDGTGLLLPIIVLEMPSVLLMAAMLNVQVARPTMYNVVKEMIDKMGYRTKPLKKNNIWHVDSGCSRHMTDNLSCLQNFERFDGGYVAFGGDAKGGKIIGKGMVSNGKLNFHDVFYVEQLKYNLLSVSQVCDKKNKILFTDSECIILAPDFKITDESQILLRTPRKENVYCLDMANASPKKEVTKFKTMMKI